MAIYRDSSGFKREVWKRNYWYLAKSKIQIPFFFFSLISQQMEIYLVFGKNEYLYIYTSVGNNTYVHTGIINDIIAVQSGARKNVFSFYGVAYERFWNIIYTAVRSPTANDFHTGSRVDLIAFLFTKSAPPPTTTTTSTTTTTAKADTAWPARDRPTALTIYIVLLQRAHGNNVYAYFPRPVTSRPVPSQSVRVYNDRCENSI